MFELEIPKAYAGHFWPAWFEIINRNTIAVS